MSEEPKDLGVKIGTKEQAFWTELKKKLLEDNENFARQVAVNIHVLELADKKIKEEEKK